MMSYKVHGDCIHSSSAFPRQCTSENNIVGYIKASLHGKWQNISLQPVCIYMKGEREAGLCLHCSVFIAYKAAAEYHSWKHKNRERLGELQLVDFCFLIRLFHGALLTARLIQTFSSPKYFPFSLDPFQSHFTWLLLIGLSKDTLTVGTAVCTQFFQCPQWTR